MNKTVNINLAGIFFHIDEDAYRKLSRYLEAIKRSFTDSQGRSEIISDIEARIAELFSERIQNEKQVVGNKLVDEVITIMGQPEDYLVDDEIFEDEPQSKKKHDGKSAKKLYRDTDNSYIGGVAAGLGHFLGIEIIWVRLIWLLLTIASGGTFIVIYLIFWALVPEAKTTAEKLTMSGDEVNISNIEKKIKDGIEIVAEKVKNVDLKKQGEKLKEGFDHVSDNISETIKNVNFQKQGNRLKSSSQTFFDTVGSVLLFFLKILAKFIGVILVIIGISTLIGLIVAFFTVCITDVGHFPGTDILDAVNAANTPIWLTSLLVFFTIGIPFFFIYYLGLKILINNLKSIGNVAKFTLLGFWVVAIIGLIIIGFKQASEYILDGKTTSKNELNIKANDTLKLKMVNNTDGYYNYSHGRRNFELIKEIEGEKSILSSDVRLIVRSTTDSLATLIIEKEARGSSYSIANKRAKNISYTYKLVGTELQLNDYLSTDISNKFSHQEVTVILYLPEGTILYADDNTHRYHQNSSYYNDILKSGMEEQYLKVVEDDLECLDCNIEDDEEKTNKSETITIREASNNQKTVIDVNINDDNGVDIKIKDN